MWRCLRHLNFWTGTPVVKKDEQTLECTAVCVRGFLFRPQSISIVHKYSRKRSRPATGDASRVPLRVRRLMSPLAGAGPDSTTFHQLSLLHPTADPLSNWQGASPAIRHVLRV